MKKTALTLFLVLASLIFAMPALASSEWDAFAAEQANKEMIKEKGASVLTELRAAAPSGTEEELWKMLFTGDARSRAAAGLALADRIFPDGEPSRWAEVSGFFSHRSVQPRQLAAMDGLFTAVSAMRELPDGVYASALLLGSFGKSAAGRLKFIDDIPKELRTVIDDVISKTGMKGDWSSEKIRGKMPLMPLYRGYITRNRADSDNMQYLDGLGSLASNGRYAWDREKGYIYEIIEDSSERIFIFD